MPPEALPALAAFLHPVVVQRLHGGLEGFVNEHRRLTVLFVGFQGPDYDSDTEATPKLQAYFARVVELVGRYGGHLRQIEMGDKGSLFIVFFGAPVLHEDDEERALGFARELLDLPGSPVHIGVTTGFTFCGSVGSATRKEYAAVGDTINLAARLMQAAGPGEALVATGSTTSPVVEAMLDRRPSIRVKGKAEPIAVAALRSSPPPGRAEGERAYELPVIARELELELGAAAVGKAAAGAGGVLLITGEPGIGKSRLAAELGRIAAQRGFSVLTGACQSTGATTSYLPWQDILRALFELDDAAPVDRQIEVLTDRLGNIDAQLVPRLPLLAPAVRLSIPETPLTDALDPELRAELLRALLIEVLRGRGERPRPARARRLPLDRPALESTAGGGWAQRRPDSVLVVVLSRAAERELLAGPGGLEHAAELRLEPLRSHDAEDLARAKLRAAGRELDDLPPAVRDAIERAEGNPFFLEELIALLLERGTDLEDPRRSHGRLSPTPCMES